MPFDPVEPSTASTPFFRDVTPDGLGASWQPQLRHDCTFGPRLFVETMMNLVRDPNLNSTWLFRADILHDDEGQTHESEYPVSTPRNMATLREFEHLSRQRTLVRRLIPRSERRDRALEQTCTFHQSAPSDTDPRLSLVIYMPHVSTAAEVPFYHPKVRGIAHLHEWDPVAESGFVSVHFLPFPPSSLQGQQDAHKGQEQSEDCHQDQDQKHQNHDDKPQTDAETLKLRRTAHHLLHILHKHGHSSAAGYTKRVQHDVVVPQARFQNRYAALKARHARRLVDTWAESTDPAKHVFEDLGIAAFLIELWAEMYGPEAGTSGRFPGFVDIGCGNGLLVYILCREGYRGWGFDARVRKSWAQHQACDSLSSSSSTSSSEPAAETPPLQQRLLLPQILTTANTSPPPDPHLIHNGIFPPGTFIISNHADELTPWTPILAALSRCPFIAIPCCSHNLSGDKFRAPLPRPPPPSSSSSATKPCSSTYACLVEWVARIASDCGFAVETEMLRIPSTRNTCLVGRLRTGGGGGGGGAAAAANGVDAQIDVDAILRKHGGAQGYAANVAKLLKSGPRSH